MAVYKKNNYRAHRNESEQTPDVIHDESTTAEIFDTLDEGTNKIELWIEKHRKAIVGVLLSLAIIGVGVFAYQQYILLPKQQDASNEFFFAQQYFDQALMTEDSAVKDSLFQKALNGTDGRYGLIDIIKEYKGTKAANLATYSAGMAYINMGQYDKAIPYLEAFSSEDKILGALALGNIADAYWQLKDTDKALSYYKKAYKHSDNNFTTPMYLKKAGLLCLEIGKTDEAKSYFVKIKDEYPTSEEARTIDVFIGKATAQQ